MGAFWVAKWISFILGILLDLHWVAEALDQLKAQYDGSALGDQKRMAIGYTSIWISKTWYAMTPESDTPQRDISEMLGCFLAGVCLGLR